jgi:hypothetical protein
MNYGDCIISSSFVYVDFIFTKSVVLAYQRKVSKIGFKVSLLKPEILKGGQAT